MIYTKTGDQGETGLYRGGRVPKDAARINAIGIVDELNSTLGWVRSMKLDAASDSLLKRAQDDLFIIGADLSTPDDSVKPGDNVMRLSDGSHEYLEAAIDRFDELLQPLRAFILPGGTPAASAIHIARSVCRRAEREVVGLSHGEPVNSAVIVYLNRLSDFLFTLAREINRQADLPDTPWEKQ